MRNSLFLLLVIVANLSFATIRISATNGNWGSTSTWQGGVIPSAGDSIIIRGGDVVTITNTVDFSSSIATQVAVNDSGTLAFNNGKRLKLNDGSVVYLIGYNSLLTSNGGGNSAYIDIGAVTVWTAGTQGTNGPVCFPAGLAWCDAVTLPVTFMYWRLAQHEEGILCEWGTANESNSDYFILEKSLDLRTFKEVARIKASGTSYVPLKYDFLDRNVQQEEVYYRLQQVDQNGKMFTTNALSTRKGLKPLATLFPNPAGTLLFMDLGSKIQCHTPFTVTILNLQGQVVGTYQMKGYGVQEIPVSNLQGNKGVYFVRIDFGWTIQTERLVIQ